MKENLKSSLDTLGLMTALSGGILGLLGNEVTKMFGTSEIPKGVVRELMEGVMDGLITHFDMQIQDLKDHEREAVDKIGVLEDEKKSLNSEIERLKENIKFFEEQVAELKIRKDINKDGIKKKPGRPKKK